MAEYIEKEKLIEEFQNKISTYDVVTHPMGYYVLSKLDDVLNNMPVADVVSIGVLEQVKWERDIAIEQLAEYGVGFGEEKKELVKVRRGRWINDGKQMLINLENAYEQYRALGYPHRIILKERCSECKKITLVDRSIYYSFCPHCGAKMERKENK